MTLRYGACCLLLVSQLIQAKAVQPVRIDIRQHLFYPSQLVLPAGQAFELQIHNQDLTAEEFESPDLNRKKIVLGKSRASVILGPLSVGSYVFFGAFYPKTAQGLLKVVP